jgi:psiF repeat-containing protein
MRKLGSVLVMTLFVSFCVVTPFSLADTPQQQKMKDCNAQASGKTGDERKAFMKECLSAKPMKQATPQQEKMKACNKEASGKALKGDDRKKFMSTCLSAN